MGEVNRFNATLGVLNAPQATEAWPYIRDGKPVPEPLRTAVGDYIGAGNYWITNQAAFVPVGYVKQGDAFVPIGGTPPPPSGDPLESFKARQRVSQNCAWVLITPTESNALRAVLGDQTVSTYNNFYTVGGSGGLGVQERVEASSPSGYFYTDHDDVQLPDVNQAADARVQEIADSQDPPRTVPAPVVVP